MRAGRWAGIALVLGLGFWLPALIGSSPAAASAPVLTPGSSVRALWVVRDALTSPASVRRVVDDAAGAGVTDLLVQVRGRGDAFYSSEIVPVAPVLREAWRTHGVFDPLALFCETAHARGIRVHAWINVYLAWSRGTPPDGHVLREHPEWVTVTVNGVPMDALPYRKIEASQSEGVYLEPGRAPAK